MPTGQENQGPDFYQQLLTSRAILEVAGRREAPRVGTRGTVLKTILGLIVGGMLGMGIVVARLVFDGRQDPETVALKDAWADTKEDLRRFAPWGRRA